MVLMPEVAKFFAEEKLSAPKYIFSTPKTFPTRALIRERKVKFAA